MQEQIDVYDILRKHAEYLQGISKESVHLRNANLRGYDLSELNLKYLDLRGADLSDTNLYGADFTGANLQGANLSGAFCIDTNFSGANLSHVSLHGADTERTDFKGADLSYSCMPMDNDGLFAHYDDEQILEQFRQVLSHVENSKNTSVELKELFNNMYVPRKIKKN